MQRGGMRDRIDVYRGKRTSDGKGGHEMKMEIIEKDVPAHVSTQSRSAGGHREGGQDVAGITHRIFTHTELEVLPKDRIRFRGTEAEVVLVHPAPLRRSDPVIFDVRERQRGV